MRKKQTEIKTQNKSLKPGLYAPHFPSLAYDTQSTFFPSVTYLVFKCQKQPSKSVLRKSCSENMQQIYRKRPMPKCDFNKVALQSCLTLLHIFRTTFPQNTFRGLLLGCGPTTSDSLSTLFFIIKYVLTVKMIWF